MTRALRLSSLTLRTSLFFTALLLTSVAIAQISSVPADPAAEAELKNLKRQIRAEQKTCPSLTCSNLAVRVRPMTPTEVNSLGSVLRARLRQAARSMALELWPDTILEGPYHVQFRVRMDQIQRLTRNNETIGYRITFSDKAWNLDRCKTGVSEQPQSKLRNCETGRVNDAGFVLNDLARSFRDESVPATYVPDSQTKEPVQADLSLNPVKRKVLSNFARITIPLATETCTKDIVEAALQKYQFMVEDLIYNDRNLSVCDDNERSRSCYEESSLVTLLKSLQGIDNMFAPQVSFRTDPGYAICEHGPACDLRLRLTCMSPDLAVEIE